MKISAKFALSGCVLLTACHKSPPPSLQPVPPPPPQLASRGPRRAELPPPVRPATQMQWKYAPSTYKLSFENLPAQVKARDNMNFLVRVTAPNGAPATDLPNTVVIGIKSGPKGVGNFRSGVTVAKVVNGQAFFTGMQLDQAGDYIFEANLSGNRVDSGTVRVSEFKIEPKPIEGAGPAHEVHIQINGSTMKAHYEPPGKYSLPNGEVYENVPFGESKAVIEGKAYSVFRDKKDNLTVKPMGAATKEQLEAIQQSLHPGARKPVR